MKTIPNDVGFLFDIEVQLKYLNLNNLSMWLNMRLKYKSIYMFWKIFSFLGVHVLTDGDALSWGAEK